MIPQLNLKHLRLIMVLVFFLGILASSLIALLTVDVYNSVYSTLHISTYPLGEAFDQALLALVLGSSLILYWIIFSFYEKDPYIQEIRGVAHFPAITPWFTGVGIILWGCVSLVRVAWHIPIIWPDPFYIGIFGIFVIPPGCIDLYRRRYRRQK